MATTGGGAAYQQLRRLDNNIQPAMEGIANRQSRANAQAKQDLKADKSQEKKNYIEVDPTKFIPKATQWGDAHEIFQDAGKKAYEQSLELSKLSNEARRSGNTKLADEYKQQYERVGASFSNFSTRRQEFENVIEKYRAEMLSGKIHQKAWGQFLDALDRNEFTLDYKDGDFIITTLKRDENGKIVEGEEVYEQKFLNDLLKGLDQPYRYEEALGEGGMVDNILVNLGKKTVDQEEGDYIVTAQKWDETRQLALDAHIKSVIGGEGEEGNNREMYKWYKNMTGEEKLDGFTDQDKARISDYITKWVKAGYGEEVSKEVKKRTPASIEAKEAADRALKRRGLEIQEAKTQDARDKAKDQLKLDWYKALNPKSSGKDVTQKEKDQAAVIKLYDVAKKVAQLPSGAWSGGGDSEVQAVLDSEGLGFLAESDWQLWGDNEFDLGSIKDIKNQDVFKIVKGLADMAGFGLEDTDIREVLMNPEKYKVKEKTGGDFEIPEVEVPEGTQSSGGFDPNSY